LQHQESTASGAKPRQVELTLSISRPQTEDLILESNKNPDFSIFVSTQCLFR